MFYSDCSAASWMICRTTPATMINISLRVSAVKAFSASGFTASDNVLNFIWFMVRICPAISHENPKGVRLAIFLISSVHPVSSNFRLADLERLQSEDEVGGWG